MKLQPLQHSFCQPVTMAETLEPYSIAGAYVIELTLYMPQRYMGEWKYISSVS